MEKSNSLPTNPMMNDLYQVEIIGRLIPLAQFFSGFIFYLIPTIIGSAVSSYIGARFNNKSARFADIVVFATVPAFIFTSIEDFLLRTVYINDLVLIGIAFVLGLLGDEITFSISSIKNLVKTYNNFRAALSAVRKGEDIKNTEKYDVEKEMEEAIRNIIKEEESKKEPD